MNEITHSARTSFIVSSGARVAVTKPQANFERNEMIILNVVGYLSSARDSSQSKRKFGGWR